MSVNINSISDCYNAWRDYKYGENTRGITPEEFRDIENRWSANLVSWKSQAEQDENQYVISDDDKQSAHDQGVQDAKDATGHDGSTDGTKSWGATIGTSVAAGGAVAGMGVAGAGLMSLIKFSKTITDCADHNRKTAGKCIGNAAIMAGIASAMFLFSKYIRSLDPNGEQAKALTTLNEEILPEANSNLAEANAEMEEASEAVFDLTDEANEANEEVNDKIEEDKTEFDMFKEIIEILQEKIANGEPLSESEKELYNELMPFLEEAGMDINDLVDENMDLLEEIYDEIGGYQEVFDEAAETMAEVEGITDYAADFDEATKGNTQVVQTGAQVGQYGSYAIVAGGGSIMVGGAAKMGSVFTVAEGIAMMALGGVTLGMGYAASDQFKKLGQQQEGYENIAAAEIDTRVQTQEFNTDSLASYEDQIDAYADNMGIVEDLEVYVPDDLDAPEEVPIPTGAEGEAPAGGTEGLYGNNDNTNGDNTDKDEDNNNIFA